MDYNTVIKKNIYSHESDVRDYFINVKIFYLYILY